jgi:hypothetical protein
MLYTRSRCKFLERYFYRRSMCFLPLPETAVCSPTESTG